MPWAERAVKTTGRECSQNEDQPGDVQLIDQQKVYNGLSCGQNKRSDRKSPAPGARLRSPGLARFPFGGTEASWGASKGGKAGRGRGEAEVFNSMV